MALFALRYARAFADVVSEKHLDSAAIDRELDDFAASLAGSRELREVLLNPAMSAEKRIEVLDALNRRMELSRWVRNFLAVLIKHERLLALPAILEEYRAEINRRRDISEAEVITARKLEKQERAELERHVAQLAGSQVNASFKEDESLIGGAIVRIGSTVYDGSVKGRLQRLKDRLVAS